MSGDLSLWNITTKDNDGFYKLTWRAKVMGRFPTWRQAHAYKLSIYQRVTHEGKLKSCTTRNRPIASMKRSDIGTHPKCSVRPHGLQCGWKCFWLQVRKYMFGKG